MRQQYRRLATFLLGALLVFDLVRAVIERTQARWIAVGIIALLLAFTIWSRAREADKTDPPQDGHK